MTVMSYIAYPTELGIDQLYQDLLEIKELDLEKSENKDIIIIVMSYETKAEEKKLQDRLSQLKSLQCMALVYAGNESDMINESTK